MTSLSSILQVSSGPESFSSSVRDFLIVPHLVAELTGVLAVAASLNFLTGKSSMDVDTSDQMYVCVCVCVTEITKQTKYKYSD